MDKIYFVSNSKEKFEEIKLITAAQGEDWDISWKKAEVTEIQEDEEKVLIQKKALEAFRLLRRPVLVEHTALKINAFNKLPGLHTNYFYSKLGCEKIVRFCKCEGDFKATVMSVFCLCDGKRYYIGIGSEEGEIIRSIDGIDQKSGFGWDVIFTPDKDNPARKTYACLENRKNNHFMRRLAWENLIKEYKNAALTLPISRVGTEDRLNELAHLIAEKRVILFVGAGISASVNFPSWKGLIDRLGSNLGYEADLFEAYGDYMMLAEYADRGGSAEVAKQLQETFRITEDIRKELYSSRIYEILENLDFPIIYTTNYDPLLEEYYQYKGREVTVIKNISDMRRIRNDIPRIMKFHGDLSDAGKDSIVLTESQYFARMDFLNFMDVQLQADMLQYPILFLGYSLSDINVKLLMYLARKRIKEHNQAINSYIYTATPNYVQEEVFLQNNIITFTGNEEDKKKGTICFLENLLEKCKKIDGFESEKQHFQITVGKDINI